MLNRIVRAEQGSHQWRQQGGQCECDKCVSGFIADYLSGRASIYDFKGGNFKITKWSAANRKAWQNDTQTFVCVGCGYPLDWRHSGECNYHSPPEQVSNSVILVLES
jgi:hypothetical protein